MSNEIVFDEPFEVDIDIAPLSQGMCPTSIATTPLGNEIIFDDECDSVTKVYPQGVFEELAMKACAHRHTTTRAMKVVR